MRSYWTWLAIVTAIWAAALLDIGLDRAGPQQWFGCAVFLGCYFAMPLARSRPLVLSGLLLTAGAAACWALWPGEAGLAGALYALLAYVFLYGAAVLQLPAVYGAGTGAGLLMLALLPFVIPSALPALSAQPAVPTLPAAYIVLLAAMVGLAGWAHRSQREELSESRELQEALLSEYRRLKRHGVEGEETVRQQERMRIARDLHDSLGHRLTALSMQLEALRLATPDPELAARLAQLKALAQDSLTETRDAVGELSQEERGGLRSVLELIRKLEAERFVRISFTLGEGVLSARLGNEQAVAIFRAVQEALTNAMRHGSRRQIVVGFEAPGGTTLRFEVENHCEHASYREGFGLGAMRERIEALGGQLQLALSAGRFTLRGTIPLERRDAAEESTASPAQAREGEGMQ